MILCLETATTICSVALINSTGVVSVKESRENKSHASLLTLFIEELLKESDLKATDLDAVAVSKGPGSYTGLRIGVSVAKGIAYAASIPLIGVDTTFSMFNGIIGIASGKYGTDRNSLFCPMLDARRMEVFYSVFDAKGKTLKKISASIIDETSFTEIPESVKMIFFGDGAAKLREIISHKNSVFADDFFISAAHMYKPVYELFHNGNFENVAYFEPYYLKDFITTVRKKNILGK
jgi:tRNA threonylcarbamoyladenosine biosynthesis protein TsaB